jgi:hypothetical protein
MMPDIIVAIAAWISIVIMLLSVIESIGRLSEGKIPQGVFYLRLLLFAIYIIPMGRVIGLW